MAEQGGAWRRAAASHHLCNLIIQKPPDKGSFEPLPAVFALSVVFVSHPDERAYLRPGREGAAPVESAVVDFDDEIDVDFLRPELLYEVECGMHCSAGGQQVVVEQHHVVGRNGVFAYLDGVGSVFLLIAFLHRLARQLARFAAEHHSGSELHGEGRGQHESAAFYSYYLGDAVVFVDVVEFVNHYAQAVGVSEQRCYVTEDDSFLRKVLNAPQVLHQCFVVHNQ